MDLGWVDRSIYLLLHPSKLFIPQFEQSTLRPSDTRLDSTLAWLPFLFAFAFALLLCFNTTPAHIVRYYDHYPYPYLLLGTQSITLSIHLLDRLETENNKLVDCLGQSNYDRIIFPYLSYLDTFVLPIFSILSSLITKNAYNLRPQNMISDLLLLILHHGTLTGKSPEPDLKIMLNE
jgi:hypothetical protein